MTREEAKKLVPIIQAYVEGKTIQYQTGDGMWMNMSNVVAFSDIADHYRVKPEPKYRPFNSKEECWNEMLKHKPFGWVVYKNEGSKFIIRNILDNYYYNVDIGGNKYKFDETFDRFAFIDNSPFGIKEV